MFGAKGFAACGSTVRFDNDGMSDRAVTRGGSLYMLEGSSRSLVRRSVVDLVKGN